MQNWLTCKDDNENIVLSSRIRLARNIKQVPFPDKLNEEKGRNIVNNIEDAFYTSSHMEEQFRTNYLWQIDPIESRLFFEKHLISNKLLNNYEKSAFILDKDETVSIMINEEDHIRLQCITAGFDLEGAYDLAEKLDNLFEEKLDYAFDENLGYLAACPTNIGTGLRASAMMHLPALSINNEMNGVLNAVTQVGMTIRGLYGEGSRAEGNLFQISNQVTLGISEEEILNNLGAVVKQIINQENYARENLMKNYRYELEDKIFRALGVLKSAVLLNSKECLNLLSNVRMGIEMGIIKDVNKCILNSLIVETQGAALQVNAGTRLSGKERDLKRAELVRKKLSSK